MPGRHDRYLGQHLEVGIKELHRYGRADGRIFTIPKLGEKLKAESTALTYTPRKFTSNPYHPVFYVIETDHRVFGPKAISRILQEKVSRCQGRTRSKSL